MDPLLAARQQQFLEVIDCAEAHRRFHEHLRLDRLGPEMVGLGDTLGRIIADDVLATVDVPGFDRANVDGFAVRAADTYGASETAPRYLKLNAEILAPGLLPREVVKEASATTIATGGMVPRGADAIVMIEYTDVEGPGSSRRTGSAESLAPRIRVTRPVSPGEHVTFAGTDIALGETVLRSGQVLTSREIGVLAAIGRAEVAVVRKPRVAILSTGDEIISPGTPSRPGSVYDSNAAILSAAVHELGGEPVPLGIVGDDEEQLAARVAEGLAFDLLLLSGGTSKGAGDLSYRVVSRLPEPGIVAHGVALKPGKPICLAVTRGKPVVILPGFPTSAIFTFHEFVAPLIRALAGQPAAESEQTAALLPMRVNSEKGRTEYLLVNLVQTPVVNEPAGDSGSRIPSTVKESGLTAFPMGKGSGSVTTFSGADGFITIDQQSELVPAGATVPVRLLGRRLAPADLVVIGSHCVGLDYLLGVMQRRGISTKALWVGSQGGLAAAGRGQCDVAGIHLMDPATEEYNRPFLTDTLELVPGYRRMQGIVFRLGDQRFTNRSIAEAVAAALSDRACLMVNRNAGSGTRILIDRLLQESGATTALVPGYPVQARSHNAVAAAVAQGRADWGVAIESVARAYGLAFLPLREECYDFVIPKDRLARVPAQEFCRLLSDADVRAELHGRGFLSEHFTSATNLHLHSTD